jgi:hypothetical protein
VTQSQYCPGIFLGGLNKTTTTLLRTAGSPAEVGTDYLPNTSVELVGWGETESTWYVGH